MIKPKKIRVSVDIGDFTVQCHLEVTADKWDKEVTNLAEDVIGDMADLILCDKTEGSTGYIDTDTGRSYTCTSKQACVAVHLMDMGCTVAYWLFRLGLLRELRQEMLNILRDSDKAIREYNMLLDLEDFENTVLDYDCCEGDEVSVHINNEFPIELLDDIVSYMDKRTK